MFVDIFPEQLQEWQDKGAMLVDVREPFEFAQGHIPNVKNIPLSQFMSRKDEVTEPVVLICATGNRSGQVAHYLAENLGFKEVANLLGGTFGWSQQGRQIDMEPC